MCIRDSFPVADPAEPGTGTSAPGDEHEVRAACREGRGETGSNPRARPGEENGLRVIIDSHRAQPCGLESATGVCRECISGGVGPWQLDAERGRSPSSRPLWLVRDFAVDLDVAAPLQHRCVAIRSGRPAGPRKSRPKCACRRSAARADIWMTPTGLSVLPAPAPALHRREWPPAGRRWACPCLLYTSYR